MLRRGFDRPMHSLCDEGRSAEISDEDWAEYVEKGMNGQSLKTFEITMMSSSCQLVKQVMVNACEAKVQVARMCRELSMSSHVTATYVSPLTIAKRRD